MRIAVLTSSRADYGIYLPLLKGLKHDPYFDLKIIAFGTHLSPFHGYTADQIKADGFTIDYKLETVPIDDSALGIADSIGETIKVFAKFWELHRKEFDLVFCLGDRYEMYAAVMAGVPFQINFAHLHGGETTLGAIDNIFRHSITLASKFHFAPTEESAERIKVLVEKKEGIYNVGSLSLDNIGDINLLTIPEFQKKWQVDLSKKTILITFHPETVAFETNKFYIQELINAIIELKDYQILITMPNADTEGGVIRGALLHQLKEIDRVFLIENLGTQSYLSAMQHCSFLLGNSSSGIIEAASFGKYVINLGDRQKGRTCGENIFHSSVDCSNIKKNVASVENAKAISKDNIYFNGGATYKIIKVLKSINLR